MLDLVQGHLEAQLKATYSVGLIKRKHHGIMAVPFEELIVFLERANRFLALASFVMQRFVTMTMCESHKIIRIQ